MGAGEVREGSGEAMSARIKYANPKNRDAANAIATTYGLGLADRLQIESILGSFRVGPMRVTRVKKLKALLEANAKLLRAINGVSAANARLSAELDSVKKLTTLPRAPRPRRLPEYTIPAGEEDLWECGVNLTAWRWFPAEVEAAARAIGEWKR